MISFRKKQLEDELKLVLEENDLSDNIDNSLEYIFDFNIVNNIDEIKGILFSETDQLIENAKKEFIYRIGNLHIEISNYDFVLLTEKLEPYIIGYVKEFVIELWKAFNEKN